MIGYDVDAKGVKEMVANLKEINPDLVKQLRADLRKVVAEVASNIKADIGAMPAPLSGFAQPGNKAFWGGVTAKPSISLANTRKITPLLGIKVNSVKGAPGYMIAETAGKKTSGITPQGQNMVAVLTDRLGPIKGKSGNRIAWKLFYRKKEQLRKAALIIVDDYARKASVRLNK
jgi:hypothetical protein